MLGPWHLFLDCCQSLLTPRTASSLVPLQPTSTAGTKVSFSKENLISVIAPLKPSVICSPQCLGNADTLEQHETTSIQILICPQNHSPLRFPFSSEPFRLAGILIFPVGQTRRPLRRVTGSGAEWM